MASSWPAQRNYRGRVTLRLPSMKAGCFPVQKTYRTKPCLCPFSNTPDRGCQPKKPNIRALKVDLRSRCRRLTGGPFADCVYRPPLHEVVYLAPMRQLPRRGIGRFIRTFVGHGNCVTRHYVRLHGKFRGAICGLREMTIQHRRRKSSLQAW